MPQHARLGSLQEPQKAAAAGTDGPQGLVAGPPIDAELVWVIWVYPLVTRLAGAALRLEEPRLEHLSTCGPARSHAPGLHATVNHVTRATQALGVVIPLLMALCCSVCSWSSCLHVYYLLYNCTTFSLSRILLNKTAM